MDVRFLGQLSLAITEDQVTRTNDRLPSSLAARRTMRLKSLPAISTVTKCGETASSATCVEPTGAGGTSWTPRRPGTTRSAEIGSRPRATTGPPHGTSQKSLKDSWLSTLMTACAGGASSFAAESAETALRYGGGCTPNFKAARKQCDSEDQDVSKNGRAATRSSSSAAT